ncbi:MAG: leucine-rich repeat domain-containing protein [Pseudomonadota bacterium]
MTAGIDIALARIAEEAVAKTGFLDLGRLGLTRLPDTLFELDHLQALNLGSSYNAEDGAWRQAKSNIAPNSLGDNLSRLSRLLSLRALTCSSTQVSDLTPLSGLASLESLDCSWTQVSDLTPLQGLASLESLDCSGTQVSDLTPLSGLASLQSLTCSSTQVSDLTPLSGLASLESLDCSWTQVSDLTSLSGLASLESLDCSSTQVSDLTPLAGLASLQSLNCSRTQVSDLTPLSGLANLQRLTCSSAQVSDLTPLSGLASLESLDCSSTQVSDLTPLAGLSNLQSLTCYSTRISDLTPLADLAGLREFDVRVRMIDNWPKDLWSKEALETVKGWGAELTGIPTDILPVGINDNCLPAIRAHLDDLGENPESLTDVKLIVLGNGRIGKTQIVNRMRGEPFEKDADSTHGVSLVQAQISGSPDAKFNIWDFGGQDIYFGTHMLFLKSRAVFMLVWTPSSDDSDSHEHGGMTFRNQPLAWWLDCIRRFGNDGSPLVVVQNRLDEDGDRGDHPALADCRDEWTWCRSVACSAATDEGRGALDDHLMHAAKRFNPPLIGKGRLAVMRELQRRREEDRERDAEDKRHRTLTFEAFKTLCETTGGISDPVQFLHFLNNAGQVFWRENLFQNQVILDQAWVLDAVYSVFDRKNCLDYLKRHHGRFTRSDLDALLWGEQGFSRGEQELFLSFMDSCGICFTLRAGSEDAEAVYIAPDHLPEDWEPEARQERWGKAPPDAELTFTCGSLPPLLMRNLICRIGSRAGLSCDYWKNGFYGYERRTDARVLVEQEMDDRWKGSIRIQVRGWTLA